MHHYVITLNISYKICGYCQRNIHTKIYINYKKSINILFSHWQNLLIELEIVIAVENVLLRYNMMILKRTSHFF